MQTFLTGFDRFDRFMTHDPGHGFEEKANCSDRITC